MVSSLQSAAQKPTINVFYDGSSEEVRREPQQGAEKVQGALLQLFEASRKADRYKNCMINLDRASVISEDSSSLKKQIVKFLENEKAQSSHVVVVTFNRQQSALYAPLIESGFVPHQANDKVTVLKRCLSDHSVESCPYPKYSPITLGVTSVVFNETLDKVLLLVEKTPLGKSVWKPPTGTVDLDKSEAPVEAAVRELAEETGIKVLAEQGRMVGSYTAKNYDKLDLNHIFAFVTSDKTPLKKQESEIAKLQWHSLEEFLKVQEDKPWVMRGVVRQALAAIKADSAWSCKQLHFSSGKPVDLFAHY